MKRNYESMLIVRSDLTEEQREEVFQKITKKVESLEGDLPTSQIWDKERNFYFPIGSRGAEKKKYNRGLYWLIQFSLNPEKLPELKEAIRLEERILRNIVIKRR